MTTSKKRRKSIAEQFAEGAAAGVKLSKDAEEVFERRDAENRKGTTRHLEAIGDRPAGDSRALDAGHVADLAESIAAVGLVQPLAVDRRGRLVAGGHRRAALRILAAPKGERAQVAAGILGADLELELVARLEALPEGIIDGGAVPVLVLDLDAEADPSAALAVEVSENERRRNYSRSEIVALADRLRKAGYREKAGRPKKGDKVLSVALGVIVGKSRATLFRALAETVSNETVSNTDPADRAAAALAKAVDRYLKAAQGNRRKVHQDLWAALRSIGEIINAAEPK